MVMRRQLARGGRQLRRIVARIHADEVQRMTKAMQVLLQPKQLPVEGAQLLGHGDPLDEARIGYGNRQPRCGD